MRMFGRALLCAFLVMSGPALADDVSNGSYSTTDGSNNAAPPNGWPAGMFPNQVEPSARANMGATARWWERANAKLSTTGAAGAYVLTPSNTSYPTAYTQGEIYCAKANFASVGNDTLNINSLGAKALYFSVNGGIARISANTILSGQQFCGTYDGSLNSGAGGFQLIGQNLPLSPTFAGDITAGHYVANGAGGGTYVATGFGETMTLDINGSITSTSGSGIRMTAHTGGVVLCDGCGSWSAISDEREKNILRPITGALNKVATLRAVIGTYKADSTKTPHPFLIAQDVQKVLPEAVSKSTGKTLGMPKGKLLMSYTDVIPLLVSALKDQVVINTDLRRHISALEAKSKK